MLLLVQRLPSLQESCSLVLIRFATDADNSDFVVVRATFSFTNSSNTPFFVVATAARASKYSSRLEDDQDGSFACGFF